MTAIVTGVYREGKLELLEMPLGLREGRVRVVLTEENPESVEEPHRLIYGKYKDYPGRESTLEDFRETEWNSAEFENQHNE
jgi:hypothetical protein